MDEQQLRGYLDNEGRVTTWPAREVYKQRVLAYLANQFAEGHSYSETEVNEILKEWHTFGDWSLLRRSLVDYGYLTRDAAGMAYQRKA